MIGAWARYHGAAYWHYVADFVYDASFTAHCGAELRADEVSANPPRARRCEACQAAYRAERRQACLAELAALEIDAGTVDCECMSPQWGHAPFCPARFTSPVRDSVEHHLVPQDVTRPHEPAPSPVDVGLAELAAASVIKPIPYGVALEFDGFFDFGGEV